MYNNNNQNYQQQQLYQPQNNNQQNPQQMQNKIGNQMQQMQSQVNQRQQQQQAQEQYRPNQSAVYPSQQNQYQQNQGGFNQNQQMRDQMSSSMVSFVDANGIRRHYPRNQQQQKSEWNALQNHKNEVDMEIRRNEKAIRDIKLKHLLSELDKKLLYDYEKKQEALLVKQLEYEELLKQQEVYNQSIKRNLDDKKLIQRHLAQYYDQQQKQQQNRDSQFRNQKKDWEQKLIQNNNEVQRLEQEKQRNQRDYQWKENLQNLQIDAQKRQQQAQDREREKDEYNKLIQIQEERQMVKDENYRQFYSNVAQQQEQQYLMHYDSVMKPMLQRMQELERIINRDADEIQKRRAQEELKMLVQRKNGYEQMNSVNLDKMREKQAQMDSIQDKKKQNVQNMLQDQANYQEYLQHQKQQKFQNQEEYKQWLDKQSMENQQRFLDDQRMTRNEKGLNRLDLQSWKSNESGMYSMLPGWAPQIGQLPPRQNREELSQQIMDTMRPQNMRQTSSMPQNMIRPNITAAGPPSSKLANAASQSISNFQQIKELQKIGERDDYYRKSLEVQTLDNVVGKEYNQGDVYRYKHNPITNPVPRNIQNPYIQRQYLDISSSANGGQPYNYGDQQQFQEMPPQYQQQQSSNQYQDTYQQNQFNNGSNNNQQQQQYPQQQYA